MAPGYSCCGWMLLSVLCTMGRCLVISSLLGGGNPEIQSVVFFFSLQLYCCEKQRHSKNKVQFTTN